MKPEIKIRILAGFVLLVIAGIIALLCKDSTEGSSEGEVTTDIATELDGECLEDVSSASDTDAISTSEELTTEEITTEEVTEEAVTEEEPTTEPEITSECVLTTTEEYVEPETPSYVEPTIEVESQASVLTMSKGVNYNEWGYKETWYNLNMSGIISIMRNMGFSEEDYPYWIREDGVKMLGPYVMVAADLSLHPRGTTVETSLGTGLVCDTGGFALYNSYQLDIAVDW